MSSWQNCKQNASKLLSMKYFDKQPKTVAEMSRERLKIQKLEELHSNDRENGRRVTSEHGFWHRTEVRLEAVKGEHGRSS